MLWQMSWSPLVEADDGKMLIAAVVLVYKLLLLFQRSSDHTIRKKKLS
jgi:hypothetical protein